MQIQVNAPLSWCKFRAGACPSWCKLSLSACPSPMQIWILCNFGAVHPHPDANLHFMQLTSVNTALLQTQMQRKFRTGAFLPWR